MSDTPLVDACIEAGWDFNDDRGILALARRLERGLAETTRARDELKRTLEQSYYNWDGRLQTERKSLAEQLERIGMKPGELQSDWRDNPEHYKPELSLLAVLDALVEMGSIPAWSGDGTSCAAQMIDAQARRCAKLAEDVAEYHRQFDEQEIVIEELLEQVEQNSAAAACWRWAKPILSAEDDPETTAKTLTLGAGLMRGLDVEKVIDDAIRAESK
jgi:hypothetical protein